MLPEYQDESGAPVEASDPNRTVWYGQCGYWTDNWSHLVLVGPGIPVCPKCKTPGFITTARDWFTAAEKQDPTDPGYGAFLRGSKGKCWRHYPNGFNSAWDTFKDARAKRTEVPPG